MSTSSRATWNTKQRRAVETRLHSRALNAKPRSAHGSAVSGKPIAPHLFALVGRQPASQQRAERALPHAALPGEHHHDVLHAAQPLPQLRRLGCGQCGRVSPAPARSPVPRPRPSHRLSHPGPLRRRRRRRASGWGIPDMRRPDPPGRCRFLGSLQGDAKAAARVPPAAASATTRRTRAAPRLSPSGCDPSATSAMAPAIRHFRRERGALRACACSRGWPYRLDARGRCRTIVAALRRCAGARAGSFVSTRLCVVPVK